MAPPVQVSTREEDSMNKEPSLSGKQIIGIIYPPPDIRNIVDKTASFVARNGSEFENRIRQNEQGNAKFNFLSPTDPYHAYYQHKVRDFTDGTSMEPSIAKPQLPDKVQEAVSKATEFVPKDPPADPEYMADPATINALDLDLIKLTALFVARNGRQFLTQLMNRESRNYQFDFLKPQHSNFAYFTKLVEQYTKVILPPKGIAMVLRTEEKYPKTVMEGVKYRVDWEKHQRRLREREEAELEKERQAYASIDWHDFVVVQTVDFQPTETANLPPPCTPKDVGARVLAQARTEAQKAAAQQVEMEMDSDSEEETEPQPPKDAENAEAEKQQPHETMTPSHQVSQPVPMPPQAANVLVRKDYDPRGKGGSSASAGQSESAQQGAARKKAIDKWVISPLTGERIPADKIDEHMRFNTIDQQYFEQRQNEVTERQEEPVFAPGVDISSNIRAFAERRTDIFGVGSKGAEQNIIGKKMDEDEEYPIGGPVDPKAIWDGHAATIDATTKAAQKKITIEQQIAEIHKAHGFDASASSSAMMPALPPPLPSHPPPVTTPVPPPPPKTPTAQPLPPPVQVPPLAQIVAQPRPPMMAAPPRMMAVPVVPVMMQAQRFMAPGQSAQMRAPLIPQMQMMQQQIFHQQVEEPPSKRQRTDADLVPEDQFKQQNPGPVRFTISIPTQAPDGKNDWRLFGQNIEMILEIGEQVAAIKQKIQEETGVPASKQKLTYESLFVKDRQSLAYYNMTNGGTVQMQLKERGGRNK